MQIEPLPPEDAADVVADRILAYVSAAFLSLILMAQAARWVLA